jgi:hypothetical protein
MRRILDLRGTKQQKAGEKWAVMRCVIRIFTRYYYDEKPRWDEILVEYSIFVNGTEEKCIRSFKVSYEKERGHLEDLGIAEKDDIKMNLEEVK